MEQISPCCVICSQSNPHSRWRYPKKKFNLFRNLSPSKTVIYCCSAAQNAIISTLICQLGHSITHHKKNSRGIHALIASISRSIYVTLQVSVAGSSYVQVVLVVVEREKGFSLVCVAREEISQLRLPDYKGAGYGVSKWFVYLIFSSSILKHAKLSE